MKACTAPVILLIAACVLTAGCTNPLAQQPAPATTVPPQATVQPTATSCPLVPGAIQVLPDYESVSITVDRNTITQDPSITTSFNGGQGLGMVDSMTVTVVRSDCIVEQQVRKKPGMGTSVTLMGTLGSDRVKVDLVMTSGEQYTVIDKLYPFPGSIY